MHFNRKSNDLFEKISYNIVKDFPTECHSTYYVPPVSKKNSLNKKSIPARGKLVNMWRNREYEDRKYKISTEEDLENEIAEGKK